MTTYMPYSHVVLLTSDGSPIKGVRKNQYSGEKETHRDNAYAMPLIVDSSEWSLNDVVTKETELPDRIIRIAREDQIDPTKAYMVEDDRDRIKFVTDCALQIFGSKKQRILEIGCSSGIISLNVARAIEEACVLGVDVRDQAIYEANSLLSKEYLDVGGRVNFRKIAGNEEELIEGAFDNVLLLEVLEHLPSALQHKVLQLAYNSLIPGGSIVLSVPNRWPAEHYEIEKRSRWKWDAHIDFFSLASFAQLVSEFFTKVEPLVFRGEVNPEDGLWLHIKARR